MKLKVMLLAGLVGMGLVGCGADGLDEIYTGLEAHKSFDLVRTGQRIAPWP